MRDVSLGPLEKSIIAARKVMLILTVHDGFFKGLQNKPKFDRPIEGFVEHMECMWMSGNHDFSVCGRLQIVLEHILPLREVSEKLFGASGH
jgi:hypothetical protein